MSRTTLVLLQVLILALLFALVGCAASQASAPIAQPALRTDLIRVITDDSVQLDGVYRTGGARQTTAVLFVHGFGRNFYSATVGDLSATLAVRGYSTLSLNMRDHDGGLHTAMFEDTTHDLDAGVRFLKEQGAQRIVLVGHSLGANQVSYYRAQVTDQAVQAVILLAPVGNAYQVAAALGGLDALATLQEANRRVAESDHPNDPLLVRLGPLGTHLYTAPSLISQGGPATNSDYLKWLPELDLPLLLVYGTQDAFGPFQRPEEARAAAFHAPRADLTLVEGADHEFSRHQTEVTNLLDSWLREVLASP
jgi:pimeloyl-ACP methyl ester carboxylesterase